METDPPFDEWLQGRGPEEDVVYCTRVRLARNLEEFAFSPCQSAEEAGLVTQTIERALSPLAKKREWTWVDLRRTEPLDSLVLVERHLISRELETGSKARGVFHDEQGRIGLMVNEEDHIRLQVFRSGLRVEETWEEADLIDDAISEVLPLAWSRDFGYLTSCPTNTGTGLRISVLLHLPALVLAKEIEKATSAIHEMGMAVRGLFGEGSRSVGDLFQVSNQRTLGPTEEEIGQRLRSAVTQLIQWERRQREEFLRNPILVEDRAYRALGILERARYLTSEETVDLISRLRLGRLLGLIEHPDLPALNRIFLLTQPGHLQKRVGRELMPQERDILRAEMIRRTLSPSS